MELRAAHEFREARAGASEPRDPEGDRVDQGRVLPDPELKAEMDALQVRKEALLAQLVTATELPPLLHPNMADLWRNEVTELREALTEDRCDPEALEAVRKIWSKKSG